MAHIDDTELNAADIAALKAAAEKQVAKERKDAASKALLEKFVAEARRATATDPDEEMVDIFIDLPEFSDRLIIDGRIYLYGHTYTVNRAQYNGIKEMLHRAYDHQDELDGKSKYEPTSRRMRVSPHGISQMPR